MNWIVYRKIFWLHKYYFQLLVLTKLSNHKAFYDIFKIICNSMKMKSKKIDMSSTKYNNTNKLFQTDPASCTSGCTHHDRNNRNCIDGLCSSDQRTYRRQRSAPPSGGNQESIQNSRHFQPQQNIYNDGAVTNMSSGVARSNYRFVNSANFNTTPFNMCNPINVASSQFIHKQMCQAPLNASQHLLKHFSSTPDFISNLSGAYFHRHESPMPRNNFGEYRNQFAVNNEFSGQIPSRTWEKIKCHKHEKGFRFTIMTYNILAQDLIVLHPYLYKRHNPDAISWSTRWPNILREIKIFNPDVLCLQEVQASHLNDYFSILEKELGYRGIYKQRTGERSDGCALYYKVNSLNLVEHSSVEYYHAHIPILNRDNVAIIAKLMPKRGSKNPFVVATTHLLYNPKRADVRLAQTQMLIAEIDKIAFSCMKQGTPCYLPVIITGDFNFTPESAVYEFITKSVLRYENLTRRTLFKTKGRDIAGKELIPSSLRITDHSQYADLVKQRNDVDSICEDINEMSPNETMKLGGGGMNTSNRKDVDVPYSSGILTHEFVFNSVYGHGVEEDMEATTYQDKWITVDYIFYSGKLVANDKTEEKLKLISRFKLPTSQQLQRVLIPNHELGSDHISLLAKFILE